MILLTGGGTGGHIFPLLAVARELQKQAVDKKIDLELRYYGPRTIYNDYFKQAGIAIKNIAGAKLRRYFSPQNFVDVPKLFWSILQSLWKVYWFMPDAAFSKGGPGALPVLLACWFYRVPIFIHESDTVPGLTNQISGRWAKKVFLGWESTKKFFPKKNTEVVGVPLREEILSRLNLDIFGAKESFGFNIKEPVVLILGGSQGAQRINDFILANLEIFIAKFQILHQVGSANYETHVNNFDQLYGQWPKELRERYKIFAFFEKNLADAYAAADLVVSRAGASAIFEIAAFGKPAILIPLPEAANDHQKINAYEYAQTGAAIVMEEANFLANVVLGQIEKVLNNPDVRQKTSITAKGFAKPKAAEIIGQFILSKVL